MPRAFKRPGGAVGLRVVWVLLGEMFPNRIRAIALSVAAAVQWVANFVVSTTSPPLRDAGPASPAGST